MNLPFPKRIFGKDACDHAQQEAFAERMREGRDQLILQIAVRTSAVHAGDGLVTKFCPFLDIFGKKRLQNW